MSPSSYRRLRLMILAGVMLSACAGEGVYEGVQTSPLEAVAESHDVTGYSVVHQAGPDILWAHTVLRLQPSDVIVFFSEVRTPDSGPGWWLRPLSELRHWRATLDAGPTTLEVTESGTVRLRGCYGGCE